MSERLIGKHVKAEKLRLRRILEDARRRGNIEWLVGDERA